MTLRGWFPVAVSTVLSAPGLAQTQPPVLPALEITRAFVRGANAGDAKAVTALFAPDARFDSVGRLYPNREAVMSRFLIPEVLGIKGQYQVLSETPDPRDQGVVTVEYRFQAGTLREHFTYRYTIQNGLIRAVVGRYVQ